MKTPIWQYVKLMEETGWSLEEIAFYLQRMWYRKQKKFEDADRLRFELEARGRNVLGIDNYFMGPVRVN